MSIVNILIKKELSSSLNTWSIYIGYIIFFCVCGFYTWISNSNLFYIGQANVSPIFVIINWTQLFFIPALTMRCIAEEKKNKTIELVLTKPIKTIELVMGKFFFCFIITGTAILLTLPYYITLAFLGEVDHGTVFLGYLGLLSISASHISIGLFASSLSRSAITAFFISLGISLCFQLLFGRLALLIGNHFIADILNFLSMEEHFDSLSRGILDTRDFIYFGSICLLFLTLTKFFICKSRF